jgi:signal transduction histidine kinase
VEHKEEQERLKDRLAALGQMAANLAHEIRNPLASIEVSSSLLKRRLPVDAGERELLDKIIAEVRRLNRTITSSLEFVKPVSLSLAPADLEGVLDDALTVAWGAGETPAFAIRRTAMPRMPAFPDGPRAAPAGVREPVPERDGSDGGGRHARHRRDDRPRPAAS